MHPKHVHRTDNETCSANLHDYGVAPANFGSAVGLSEAVFELVEGMEEHNRDCVVQHLGYGSGDGGDGGRIYRGRLVKLEMGRRVYQTRGALQEGDKIIG